MYFVFDIETIPDFDLIQKSLKTEIDDEDTLLEMASEKLAQNKSGFLPPMYHQILSWVGFWIEHDGTPKSEHKWTGTNEQEGINELIDTLSRYKDFRFIHHNGRGFDLPLILYRAMKFELQLPVRFYHYDIRYRYSKDNVDLVDEFSNYGASSWPKLKQLGLLVDIPFKQTGEGNLVLEMFRNNQLDEIERYCLEDVIATYLIWLQLRYTIGELQKTHFQSLKKRALTKLQELQKMD